VANTMRLAGYVREKAGPGMQFVVISLKSGLFQESETLVGVLRDQGVNSSRALTLDVSTSRPHLSMVRMMLTMNAVAQVPTCLNEATRGALSRRAAVEKRGGEAHHCFHRQAFAGYPRRRTRREMCSDRSR